MILCGEYDKDFRKIRKLEKYYKERYYAYLKTLSTYEADRHAAMAIHKYLREDK